MGGSLRLVTCACVAYIGVLIASKSKVSICYPPVDLLAELGIFWINLINTFISGVLCINLRDMQKPGSPVTSKVFVFFFLFFCQLNVRNLLLWYDTIWIFHIPLFDALPKHKTLILIFQCIKWQLPWHTWNFILRFIIWCHMLFDHISLLAKQKTHNNSTINILDLYKTIIYSPHARLEVSMTLFT